MEKAQIGLIGLAVMGANIARNIADKKFPIVVFNRTTEKTEKYIEEFGNDFLDGAKTIEEFIDKLEKPRKIILMVKSGDPVDAVIEQLLPHLEKDDVIIDFGNSNYHDTERRAKELEEKGLHFVGSGVSGGEEGALHGPSIMPGGSEHSWNNLKPILEAIAAKDFNGDPCVAHIGPEGAGHFVKTVHNGIEYGIMQLIAESYDILKNIGQLSNQELADFYANLNQQPNFESFLVEITAKIFTKKDDQSNLDVIDIIKDSAGQKGTGKWTTISALTYGVATPTINSAVDARIISGSEDLRNRHQESLPKHIEKAEIEKAELTKSVEDALELSIICAYAQGFELLKTASEDEDWNLNLSEISRIWQGGCIIRSRLLEKFAITYGENPSEAKKTKEKMLEESFNQEKLINWRKTIAVAAKQGIPVLTTNASLAYYDSLASKKLPQNLTQAQRDFFGAHTYKRTDKEGTFHTDWE